MQRQLFPPEIIEHSTEAYLPKVSPKSQFIYTIILLSILLAFASLPFIYIDVSVRSAGLIRTLHEKTEIKSLVSGTVKKVKVSENEQVKEKKTLFVVATEELDSKLTANSFQQEEKQQFINDLRHLVQVNPSNVFSPISTATPIYTQQLNQFRSQLQENIFHQQKIKKELNVDKNLFREKIIAQRELDAKQYDMNRLSSEFESLVQRQLSEWQADLNKHQFDLKQLQNEAKQVKQQRKYYEIR